MIQGRPYDDSRTQGPFYNPPEPQYQCAAKDCGYLAWEPGELHECIVCKGRFCADHLIAIGGEKFCPAHAKCACGEPAIDACMECGAVLCAGCLGDSDFCKNCDCPGDRRVA